MYEQSTFWAEPSREGWWNSMSRQGTTLLKRLRAATCDRMIEKREWTVSTPSSRRVTVEHFWNGAAGLVVDGEKVHDHNPKYYCDVADRGFEHRFELDGLPCIVRVLRRGPFGWYEYELYLDGRLQ